jgi:hypothetical protein
MFPRKSGNTGSNVVSINRSSKAPAKAPAKKASHDNLDRLVVQAPSDFSSHFVLVEFHTEANGLIGSDLLATRCKGRAPESPVDLDPKKSTDMFEYDAPTVVGIAACLGGVTFKSAPKVSPHSPRERNNPPQKPGSEHHVSYSSYRLPPNTAFFVLIRVSNRRTDNSLHASVKTIWQVVNGKNSAGKKVSKAIVLAKTDPSYRLIRRANRSMAQVFKDVQQPPKRTRGKAAEADEE